MVKDHNGGVYAELKLVSRPIRIDSRDDRCRGIEARVVDRGYVKTGRKFCRCTALHINVGDVGRRVQNKIYLMHKKTRMHSKVEPHSIDHL